MYACPCAYIYVHAVACVQVSLCVDVWKTAVGVGYLFQLFSVWISETGSLSELGARLGDEVSSKHSPVPTPSPSSGITGTYCHTQHFTWMLGIKFQSSRLHGRYFTNWAISPVRLFFLAMIDRKTLASAFLISVYTVYNIACPILFSVAVINTGQMQLGAETVYLTYTTQSQSIWREVRAGSQVRNLEAGSKTEAIEESCLLACPCSVLCFLIQSRPSAQR